MRSVVLLAAVGLTCSGCAYIGPPPAELAHIDIRQAPDDPNCKAYTAAAEVGTTQEDLIGRACMLPGGAWAVTEGTAANPRKFQQTVSAAQVSGYPWRSGPPVGISTGRLVYYYPWDEQRTGSNIWYR